MKIYISTPYGFRLLGNLQEDGTFEPAELKEPTPFNEVQFDEPETLEAESILEWMGINKPRTLH